MTASRTEPNEAAAGDLLAAALAYAERGWHVFPVKPDKAPLTTNGFKDATTEADQVRFWWELWPDAGIAIATGARSGLVVLDEDNRSGGVAAYSELTKRVGVLPLTYTVLTGGGGRHLYFRHPGGEVPCSSGKLGAGLDVRGDGGYAIAPPTMHSSGNPYTVFRERELAPWPAEQLNGAAHKRKRAEKKATVIPGGNGTAS
jgi:putative DNA primase/helicase